MGVSSLGGSTLRVVPATKNANLSDQMDSLPKVLLVEKCVKQQVAAEKTLRKEGFQWDLAINGDQAVSYFTRLSRQSTPPGGASSAPSSSSQGYHVVVLSDSVRKCLWPIACLSLWLMRVALHRNPSAR